MARRRHDILAADQRAATSSSSGSSTSSTPAGMTPTADALLAHTGAGDSIQLWRYDARGGAWNYAGSYDAAGLQDVGLSEFARQRGGGGKYRARIRRPDGTYGRSFTFTIEGQSRTWNGDGDGMSATASSSAPAAAIASSSAAPPWLNQILLPFATTFATALAGFLAKKLLEGPRADPLIVKLLEHVNAGQSIDPVELQKLVADAEQRGEQRGAELGKLRATVDRPHDAPRGRTIADAIDAGLPQVVGLLNKKLEIDARNGLPLGESIGEPLAGPIPTPIAPGDDMRTRTAGAGPTPADPLITLFLSIPAVGRRFLLDAATNDEPPELYADLLLNKLDDVTYARMPELTARGDFVDVFVAVLPAFQPYRAWCEQLAAAIRANLEDDATAAAADQTNDGGAAAGAGD